MGKKWVKTKKKIGWQIEKENRKNKNEREQRTGKKF